MKIKSMIALAMSMCMSATAFAGIGTAKAENTAAGIMREYYISTEGRVNASGTKEDPFATLEQAKEAVRTINTDMTGDIVVYVEDGTYEFEDEVVFEEADSGTNEYSVRYEAVEGAEPVFSGGSKLEATWTKEENGIYSAPLERDEKLRAMYVNDVLADMTSKKIQGRGGYGTYNITTAMGEWAWKNGSTYEGTILDYDETLFNTRNPEDIELETEMTWNREIVCVERFEDIGNNQMAAMLQMPYAAIALSLLWNTNYSTSKMQTVYNVFEWLDEPGEFYFDKAGQRLYYYPREGEDMSTAEVVIPRIETLVSIEGTSRESRVNHISFDGLTFAYTDWNLYELEGSHGRATVQAEEIATAFEPDHHTSIYRMSDLSPAAVEVTNAEYLSFTGNTFKNVAAIGLSLVNDVVHTTADGNKFMWTGGSAIVIGHMQHMYIDDKGSNYGKYSDKEKYDIGVEGSCQYLDITNNYLYQTCTIYPGDVAFHIFAGSYLNVQYNMIDHTPYSGMNVGWGWHNMNGSEQSVVPGVPYEQTHHNMIQNNTIKNTLEFLSDGGAVYTLGDMPYSEMNENVILDIGPEIDDPNSWIRAFHSDQGTKHLSGKRNVMQIPATHPCIDCGEWSGYKGYNNWDDNYSTSSIYASVTMYSTDENFEEGSVVTNPHTFPDGYWNHDVFDIVQKSGIESSYYKEMPSEFIVQNQLLPTNFKLDAGALLQFHYEDGDIDGEVWLAPEGTETFVESDTVRKLKDSQVTVPYEDEQYRIYIVKDGVASEPSVGEIILAKRLPLQHVTYDDMTYLQYDVSDVNWNRAVRMFLSGTAGNPSGAESKLQVYAVKPDVDFTSQDDLEAGIVDHEKYVSSETYSGTEFSYEMKLKALVSLLKEQVSDDGKLMFAIKDVNGTVDSLYSKNEKYCPVLEVEEDENVVCFKCTEVQSGNLMLGRGRSILMKVDLSDLEASIAKATLSLSYVKGKVHAFDVFLMPDMEWTPDNFVSVAHHADEGKQYLMYKLVQMNDLICPDVKLNVSNENNITEEDQKKAVYSARYGVLANEFYGDYAEADKDAYKSVDVTNTLRAAMDKGQEEATLLLFAPQKFSSTADFYGPDNGAAMLEQLPTVSITTMEEEKSYDTSIKSMAYGIIGKFVISDLPANLTVADLEVECNSEAATYYVKDRKGNLLSEEDRISKGDMLYIVAEDGTEKEYYLDAALSDEEALAVDMEEISDITISDTIYYELPTEGTYGSQISWEYKKADEPNSYYYDLSNNEVHLPAYQDVTIPMRATFTCGELEPVSKDVNVIIKQLDNYLMPSDDAYIEMGKPTVNYGSVSIILSYDSGRGGPGRTGLVRFDLKEIKEKMEAENLTISNATFGATYYWSKAPTIDLYAVDTDWKEETATYENLYSKLELTEENRILSNQTFPGKGTECKMQSEVLAAKIKEAIEAGKESITLVMLPTSDSATGDIGTKESDSFSLCPKLYLDYVAAEDTAVKGDVNGNGTVTAVDALLALSYVNQTEVSETIKNRADMDEDNAITEHDVVAILTKATQA
ncbi:MAG: DNRLRE domain-containing protein [Lachnospiraceae bacterium]